jgi:trehalose utilization protein
MAEQKIRVTIWNEFRHEKTNEIVKKVYPKGIHGAIAEGLEKSGGFAIKTASLDEPEHGLTEAVLNETDVLTWWGHLAHGEVKDEIVSRVQKRVLAGMGLIVLHSGHGSKIFRRLMGTHCSLQWRGSETEHERFWDFAPGHEITRGVPDHFELEHEEMYGEFFDIPEPDKLIFISWFKGGDVFRSGACFERGNGRIFYFRPGHETHPTYFNPNVRAVIVNACRWANPRVIRDMSGCPNTKAALEKLE